jgi:hypothetical protein
MHRNLLNLVVLFIGTTIFVSCGGSDKHAIAVPKDAAFVFHINAPSLSSKLSWAEIKATSWFKDLHAGADDSVAQQLLDNPENSGINTSANLAIFAKRRGGGGYLVFEGTLTDAAKFEAFNKKIKKGAATTKDGDISIIKDNNNIVTWNNSKFIYMSNAPFMGAQSRFMDNSSLDNSGTDQFGNYPADSLIKFAKEIYTLKGDNSLFSDKRFADLIKEPGDLHMWFNAEHMYGGSSNALNMLKLGSVMEGNVTAGAINFDNGKITMKSKSYYNKELGKLYEKYKMKNFDAAVLNRIPSQNIVGLFSMNYPPEGLQEFMKVLGLDGMINSGLAEINLTIEEFVKANKGEVLLALTDFGMVKQQFKLPEGMEGMEGMEHMNRTINKPDFKVLFAASINDKAAFTKMVTSMKEKLGNLPEQSGLPPFSYSMNDNWFAASNSEEYVNKFLAGGNNNWPAASKLGGHPIIFYVDLQKIMQPMAADSAGQFGGVALSESMKMWENIIGTGGELVDGAMIGNFEVNLVDKNTNALKQLNQYVDKLAGSRKKAAF